MPWQLGALQAETGYTEGVGCTAELHDQLQKIYPHPAVTYEVSCRAVPVLCMLCRAVPAQA
jgi:hypothetical protein